MEITEPVSHAMMSTVSNVLPLMFVLTVKINGIFIITDVLKNAQTDGLPMHLMYVKNVPMTTVKYANLQTKTTVLFVYMETSSIRDVLMYVQKDIMLKIKSVFHAQPNVLTVLIITIVSIVKTHGFLLKTNVKVNAQRNSLMLMEHASHVKILDVSTVKMTKQLVSDVLHHYFYTTEIVLRSAQKDSTLLEVPAYHAKAIVKPVVHLLTALNVSQDGSYTILIV